MSETRHQIRDTESGQYTDRLENICRCGHAKGAHTAERSKGYQPCIEGDFGGEPCECESYKKARAAKR